MNDLAIRDDWVRRVLAVDPRRTDDGVEGYEDLDELGLDALDIWVAARDAYDEASAEVDAQITALQAALLASDDAEMQEIGEFGLNGLTGNVRVPLMAALQEAGSSSIAAVAKAGPKLSAAVAGFRAKLASEPRIEACDENPLDVDVAIRATFEGALGQLENALRLVAAKAPLA